MMNRENRATFNDPIYMMPEVSLPQSDLRTGADQQRLHSKIADSAESHGPNYASSAVGHLNGATEHFQHSFLPANPVDASNSQSSGLEYYNTFSAQLHYNMPNPFNSQNAFSESGMDQNWSTTVDDQDFASALANFQPCHDCTPSTKTTIPHHHHTRLLGAAATLDGHFCCSWQVYGQTCFLCFESAEALDNHIRNDHAGKDGTYQCLWQDCSKSDIASNNASPLNFGNKPKLMRHVHSHTGYKPFPCIHPGCDKGFVTKEQLKNHETTHTKSRKYKCDVCGKAFAVKSALTTHITAVHEERKIHTCEICGKSFADSSNLSKHKQTHFRKSDISRARSTRGTSISTSTRSTPSEPATPRGRASKMRKTSTLDMSPGLMGPPAIPRTTTTSQCCTAPLTNCAASCTSPYTSSLPLDNFDPNCYCCEQRCSPPAGPVSPCDEAEECALDGFCDLPECAASPCGEADSCNLEGFCDLPECLTQIDCGSGLPLPKALLLDCHHGSSLSHSQTEQSHNFEVPHQWDDLLDQGSQRICSHFELEKQLTSLHGS